MEKILFYFASLICILIIIYELFIDKEVWKIVNILRHQYVKYKKGTMFYAAKGFIYVLLAVTCFLLLKFNSLSEFYNIILKIELWIVLVIGYFTYAIHPFCLCGYAKDNTSTKLNKE